MKIQKTSTVITEVPGIESIIVEADAHSEHGVHTVIYRESPERVPQDYGYTELGSLIEALQAAHAAMRELAGLPEEDSERVVRRWTEGCSEPIGVTSVIDEDGDRWVRESDGTWWHPASGYRSWAEVLSKYGPVTE